MKKYSFQFLPCAQIEFPLFILILPNFIHLKCIFQICVGISNFTLSLFSEGCFLKGRFIELGMDDIKFYMRVGARRALGSDFLPLLDVSDDPNWEKLLYARPLVFVWFVFMARRFFLLYTGA